MLPGRLTPLLWWVAALSLVAFLACIVDKARAGGSGRRIPERVLLGLALAGGSPGLIVGMLAARHKTRKAGFVLGLGGVLALQGLAWWLLSGR